MSAATLESALAATGIIAAVEARERLALIIAADQATANSISAQRAHIVAVAAMYGFSHVALEIASGRHAVIAGRSDAAFPGD